MSSDPRWMWRLAAGSAFLGAVFLSHFVMPDQPALAIADSLGAAVLATASLMLLG